MIEIEERVTLLLTTRAAVLSLRLLLLLLSRLLQPPMIENNYDIDSTKNYSTPEQVLRYSIVYHFL